MVIATLTLNHELCVCSRYASNFISDQTAHNIKLGRTDGLQTQSSHSSIHHFRTCKRSSNACNPDINAACWQQ